MAEKLKCSQGEKVSLAANSWYFQLALNCPKKSEDIFWCLFFWFSLDPPYSLGSCRHFSHFCDLNRHLLALFQIAYRRRLRKLIPIASWELVLFVVHVRDTGRGLSFHSQKKLDEKNGEKMAWEPMLQKDSDRRFLRLIGYIPAPSKGCQLNPKGWWIDTL